MENHQISDYELLRSQNIERNRQFLEDIGLKGEVSEKKRITSYSKKRKLEIPMETGYERRSSRLSHLPDKSYKVSSLFQHYISCYLKFHCLYRKTALQLRLVYLETQPIWKTAVWLLTL